ncbi:unnamed protein product, partial [Plutella xylostella]
MLLWYSRQMSASLRARTPYSGGCGRSAATRGCRPSCGSWRPRGCAACSPPRC